MPVAIAYCVHDDVEFFEASIQSFVGAGDIFAFVSTVSWNTDSGNYEAAINIAKRNGATVVTGAWNNESSHRTAVLTHLRNKKYTHALIPDSDEVIEPKLLATLLSLAVNDLADRVYVETDTYWRSAEFVVRPRERFTPTIFLNLNIVSHHHLREYVGGRALFLNHEYGVLHHLSYAGTDQRIHRKITTWSHRDEIVHNWYNRIWKGWDVNPLMHNLHPTHPEAYGWIERIEIPEILKSTGDPKPRVQIQTPTPPVSIVIPVYGAEEELANCLSTLAQYAHELHEVIVVDNASPETAREVAKSFPFVTLIENTSNLGFAKACNQGAKAATGEFVLFLNSDAYMPYIALQAMCRSIAESGSIAAVGPYSNNVGHFQKTQVTYTSLSTMSLFADTFASMDRDDVEVDMLVGFCLLVRKRVLDEVGLFDESFGLGLFEDNDLCYRMRRAGYRLLISRSSFVHHVGSRTISSAIAEPQKLLEGNQVKYMEKWKEDIALGYASHLPGLSGERVMFNESRKPEKLKDHYKKLAKQAKVSLCMIVKNEERVLGDCLKSASPFFFERIVVDTGSTDRTKDIASDLGAAVHDFPWCDSFSAARNESLKYATGDWVFWMDADDTLPPGSGEAILNAAINAPPEVHGFVIPVQFVDDGSNSVTRVDHVKLFRRYPDLAFTFRIHEQILPSLNTHSGQIVRCDAVVLHSGYDTSDQGQQRKRERDEKLLKLDLEENPDHPFILFNLGMTAHFTGEHEDAIKWLTLSIEKSKGPESHIRMAYALKAISVREFHGPDAAIGILQQGLTHVGWDPELNFHMGMTYSHLGQTVEAITAYERTLSGNTVEFYSSYDVSITGHKAMHNLANLYLEKGDYARAKEIWEKALATTPTFTPSAFSLFDAALNVKDFGTAKAMVKYVQGQEGFSPSVVQMTEKLGVATGGPEGGKAALEQAAVDSHGLAHVVLALARFLLTSGWENEATPHLEHLARHGSPEALYFLGVSELRKGRMGIAKQHFAESLRLNPGHEQTIQQLEALSQVQ